MLINKMESQARALKTVVAGDYTALVGDGGVYDVVLEVDKTTGNITITVPDGTFVGQPLVIWVDNNTSGNITVLANGGTVATLTTAGDYLFLTWAGDDWHVTGPKAEITCSGLIVPDTAIEITGTLATSAGASAGKYISVVNGGTTYKIALLAAS